MSIRVVAIKQLTALYTAIQCPGDHSLLTAVSGADWVPWDRWEMHNGLDRVDSSTIGKYDFITETEMKRQEQHHEETHYE